LSGSNVGTTVAGITGSAGSSRAQLYNPYAIAVNGNDTMYILDTSNNRVLKWAVGDPLGYIVAGGNGAGTAFNQIGTCYAMFVDNQNNIYVSDSSNNRVTKWLSTSTTTGLLVMCLLFINFNNKCFLVFLSLNYRWPEAMVPEVHKIN
jgi:sugar lactone lactonase YvrE